MLMVFTCLGGLRTETWEFARDNAWVDGSAFSRAVELRLTLLVSEVGLIVPSRGWAVNAGTRWLDRRRRDAKNMMVESRSFCFEYREKKEGEGKTVDSRIVQGQDVDCPALSA